MPFNAFCDYWSNLDSFLSSGLQPRVEMPEECSGILKERLQVSKSLIPSYQCMDWQAYFAMTLSVYSIREAFNFILGSNSVRNRFLFKYLHRNNIMESLPTSTERIFVHVGLEEEKWGLEFMAMHHKSQTSLMQDKQKPSWCWTTVKMINSNDKNQAWLMSLD